MKYYVIEIQTNADGTAGTLVYDFTDRNAAYAKYHTVLAAAATSSVMVHACTILTREGVQLEHEHFVHPAPEPEPNEE